MEIAISITRFRDVLEAKSPSQERGTEFTMKLRRKHPQAFIKGDDIYVARPGAALRFTLASTEYFPLGIAFLREGGRSATDAQRLGLLSFPQAGVRLEKHSIAVLDTYRGDKKSVRYKFSLVIQRGSDGKIGIIDPGIIHEDNHRI